MYSSRFIISARILFSFPVMDKINHEAPGDGLLDRTPETDSVYEHFFTANSGSLSFKFCNIANFKNISFFIYFLTWLEN